MVAVLFAEHVRTFPPVSIAVQSLMPSISWVHQLTKPLHLSIPQYPTLYKLIHFPRILTFASTIPLLRLT